ncbi:extracellular solute-binding protein [Bosea sp. (in: a-proteobacteria)]|uniref:ABC transporter substrate-binding protein n=1 Tax=Bosea sp. (in: a-proteobacteria) TaxID=1871050 RepID=UPI001AC71957|nr:extracellular solute-binding protein [Bosea sp. (in: a-proteobacteria)]MBN9444684.1 extracellular solute-binding protein [Bosea sp. (in: a-proteobacteria)]
MTGIRLRGMTWDHPRGYDPLVACSALYKERSGVEISWEKRSLQDFESFPVEELARRYDLIVIDHPHAGQVAREGCLYPLDQPDFSAERRALLAGSVGLSYHSYVFGGRLWALPLDAATQVQAWRPDLLERAPESWDEVVALARAGKVILPLRAPHSLMCVMTLAANLGWQPGDNSEDFMPPAVGEIAVGQLVELASYLDKCCFSLDPIVALDLMANSDDLACCPLVYGYVSYAHAGFRQNRLAFADIPCLGSSGPLGSVLGGTGLAVSARSAQHEAALKFAYWVTSGDVQRGPYATAGGQPGHGAAWLDPAVDRTANGFYSRTRATLEGAMLRPRHDGYMAFQGKVARLITEGLFAKAPAKSLVEDINRLARETS